LDRALDSSRNVFIVGLSLFAGLAIPAYMNNVESAEALRQGMAEFAYIGDVIGTDIVATTVFVIGSTGMAVGLIIAFVLDNTVEGTREERGLEEWEAIAEDESDFESIFDRLGITGGGEKKPPAPGGD
jgi:xanthine/uracil permease